MKKRMVRILILILVGCLLLSGGYALASDISSALYYALISVGNSSGEDSANVSTTADISTPNLIAGGSSNSTATNMVMRNNAGADVPFMPGYDTNPWVLWIESLPANSYFNYLLYTAESTGGLMRYFPNTGGMTTNDSATLELGNNFEIEQKVWIDTSAGANKNLIYKEVAFKTYVSGLDNVTSEIGISEGSADLQVKASYDDCMVQWTGTEWVISLTSVAMQTGYTSAAGFKLGGGMRFLDVTIPKGATITTAYLTLRSWYNRAATTVNTRIIGEDIDNAATFSNVANYQARRGTVVGGADDDNITTAQVDWDAIPAWVAGTDYDSPEIKAIIQEIVNRAGWTSGNDMVLFWDDHAGRSSTGASVVRQADSYNTGATYAPKLHIEWGPSNYVAVTAGGVSSGVHTIRTVATGGVTDKLQIWVGDGDAAPTLRQEVGLGGNSVPGNDSNWSFVTNDSAAYMNYHKIWVGGTLKQHIVWEYDTIFHDLSGNNHDATPTFRTTPSDADVTTTVTSFQPISEAKAPTFTLGETPPWITETPPISGNFTSGITPTFPGAGIITAVAEESDTPSQLPLTIIAGFIILAISLTVSGYTKRAGSNSLLLKAILIGSLMAIAIATLVFDFWMLMFFAIIAVALAMGSQQKGWI